jgi:outer membrane protein TolC
LDLAALEASIAAARADLDLERQRRRRPQTQAGLSGERPERGSAMTFLTGLAGSIRLPIFDQNLAQVARAQARLESLEKQRAALAAEIELELSAARQRRAAAEQAVREIESGLLSSASENRALAERLFELGERDLAARLEAQRTWLRARRLLIEARLERGRSELALERALGASLDAP